MKIGYSRVSTEDQNLDLQIRALKIAGCIRIISDHGVSGSHVRRPGLDRLLRTLKSGDQLVVWRLDRLGRSLSHLVALMAVLERRGVAFWSLTENIDTVSSSGRLLFHVMAALAEFERSLISERTRAGVAAARARGTHVGRPPSLSREELSKVVEQLTTGELSVVEVARSYNIKERTLTRMLRRNGVDSRIEKDRSIPN